jgi:LPS sulfotransferase NodH
MSRTPTAFVVLTFPRSGSTWLMSTLDSHPRIAAYDELFLGGDGFQPRPADMPDFASFVEGIPRPARRLRPLHRASYLRALYRARPGIDAVGFKLVYGQARANPGLFPFFALRRVRAVHLIRANLLDAVVSYEAGRASGVFHRELGEPVPVASITLDAEGLRDRLGYMEWATSRARVWLERYRLPRLEVAYEELSGRHDETIEAVLRFLGVEPRLDRLHSPFVPVRGGSKLDLVENADDVRAALRGTRFEWMLGRPGSDG